MGRLYFSESRNKQEIGSAWQFDGEMPLSDKTLDLCNIYWLKCDENLVGKSVWVVSGNRYGQETEVVVYAWFHTEDAAEAYDAPKGPSTDIDIDKYFVYEMELDGIVVEAVTKGW